MAEVAWTRPRDSCSYPWLSYWSLVSTHTPTVTMGTPARIGHRQGWSLQCSGKPLCHPSVPCPQKHVSSSVLDVAGRYNLPTFSRRRKWCPSLVLCLCHLLATLLSLCSSITPRHLGWAFADPGGCGKGRAVLMRPHFQQLWALAGTGGCPPRPCRRCWGGDMLGAALGTSGQVGVRSGRSQVVPAWACPGCPQAHPSP